MPQIPSRLPREYESPSPDHRTWYTRFVNTVLRYSNVLHLHQRVCHKVGDFMVRTSRFTATFHIGHRLQCVSCPKIHLLQSVKLFLLPIPTIKVIFIARVPKLLAKRLCPLEPQTRWQWWHHLCGFVCGFVNFHLITMVSQYLIKGPQINGLQWHIL